MHKYKKYKIKYWADLFLQPYGVNVDIILYKNSKLLSEWVEKYKKIKIPLEEDSLGSTLSIGDNNYVIFLKENVEIDTIVHECVHVTQFVCENIGMYNDCVRSVALMEAEAYLTGALFTEVFNRIKKYVKLDYNWITIPKKLK